MELIILALPNLEIFGILASFCLVYNYKSCYSAIAIIDSFCFDKRAKNQNIQVVISNCHPSCRFSASSAPSASSAQLKCLFHPSGGCFSPVPCPLSLTRLTVLTVLWHRFAAVAVIRLSAFPTALAIFALLRNLAGNSKIVSSIVDRTFTRHGILRPQR